MKTKCVKIDEKNIDIQLIREMAEVIKNKGLVAFPTETVYGLGANGLSSQAVKKIFQAKGRPADNPLILHIAKKENLNNLVKEVSQSAKILIENFWPGPLTVVLKCNSNIPKEVTAGLNTVAIRMPKNEIARLLIENAEVPIAAPSANLSGRPSPTNANMVKSDLEGKIEAIILSEICDIGLESTVVDCTNEKEVVILRPGSITEKMISKFCKVRKICKEEKKIQTEVIPIAPGMKYKHYSPSKPVFVFCGKKAKQAIEDKIEAEQAKDKVIAVLISRKSASFFLQNKRLKIIQWLNYYDFGKKLYQTLVDCEKECDLILVEGTRKVGLGKAIMNRLEKIGDVLR